jgi:hypothetical protein
MTKSFWHQTLQLTGCLLPSDMCGSCFYNFLLTSLFLNIKPSFMYAVYIVLDVCHQIEICIKNDVAIKYVYILMDQYLFLE